MARSTGSDRDGQRAHWGMLLLAWLLYVVFGLISASLFPLITPIRADLGLSYAQFGLILGIWQLVYIPAALPVGLLVDRLGTKRALLLGALCLAASGLARSLAVDFISLLGAVALFGLGGPIISIGLPKLIAEWFTGERRGLATGLYATGSSVGTVTTLILTNSLLMPLTGSWRITIQIYAGLALLMAVAWLVLGRGRPVPTDSRSPSLPPVGRREMLGQRSVVLVVLIGFAGFMSTHGLRSWLPQLFESRGLSPADAGLLAAVPTVLGIVGSIVVLRLVGLGNHRLIALALLSCTALSIAVVALGSGLPMIAGVLIYGFCSGAIMPLSLNLLMELPTVGARAMGAAAGLYFAVGEIGGFLGPTIVGVLADRTGTFAAGLLVLATVMGLMLLPASRLPLSGRELRSTALRPQTAIGHSTPTEQGHEPR